MEAIVSILLLTILLTTITVMIQTSFRLTANAMREAEDMQELTFNPAVFDTHPNLLSGTITFFFTESDIEGSNHEIHIFIDTTDIVSFYPDTEQFEG